MEIVIIIILIFLLIYKQIKTKPESPFVDNVLSSVGYQILHVRAINIESIEATIAEIFIHNK